MTFLSKVLSTIPASHSVTYNCTFYNNWSMENHPVNYPDDDAHWSPPVIAAHTRNYKIWESGGLATPGVELVAELGATSILSGELTDAAENGEVGEFIQGEVTYNSDIQSQMFDDIVLTPWFDRMSSVTMIAPSPDWFTGFDSVRPIDNKSDVWLQTFEVATYPWDAGTEMGDTFRLRNAKEDPHVPIMQYTVDTVPSNGVLLNADQTEVLPMATWMCTIKSDSCDDHDDVMFRGDENKDCAWAGAPSGESNRRKRCNKRYLGRRLRDYCPNACGMC